MANPYNTINVAQINDALQTYQQSQTIVQGLSDLKASIVNSIVNPSPCPQCGELGTIDSGSNICPLCNGMTQTSGAYIPQYQNVTYKQVS